MKLSLRFFIPLVGITALSVSAPAADMISHSGHARTRLSFDKNAGAADTDFSETWTNRLRLNVDVSPSKTLMVRVAPEASFTWGGTATTTATKGDAANLTAQEAWMSWTASDLLTLYVGRQELSYGKGLIIGRNDWGATTNYFDAARARLTYDLGHTDIFFAKLNERPMVATQEEADRDLYALYTSLNPDMGVLKDVDFYALWNDNRQGGANRSRIATLGTRVDGDIRMIDYNLELTAQFGKENSVDLKGFQADLTAGAKVMSVHRVALNIAYANSEFTDQFPDRHAQLGKADILSRNNILAFALLTGWKLHDKWRANIDGYYFMAAKDSVLTAGGLALDNGKRNLGLEGDIALAYTPEKNLTFDGGYNVFKGQEALKTGGHDKVYSGLFVEGTVTF